MVIPSDSVANFSALSNPADAQNVSCLVLYGRDICPKSYALYGLDFQSSVVSIYIVNKPINLIFMVLFNVIALTQHFLALTEKN